MISGAFSKIYSSYAKIVLTMRIGDADLKKLLIDSGQVKADALDEAVKASEGDKQPLQTLVLKRKLVNEKDLTKIYAKFIGVPFTELTDVKIPHEVLIKIPERIARKYQTVLFGFEEN
jgi:hypothetical protein